MDSFPDVVAMTDEQLKDFIHSLVREADVLGGPNHASPDDPFHAYRRRVLVGKSTIARAELDRRWGERGRSGD
jgi:hypothetical protein